MGAKKSTLKKGLDPLDAGNKPIPSLPYKSSSLNDHEEWLDELKNQGYTVVRGIANEEDVLKARELLWSWLEENGKGVKKDDPKTWTQETWPVSQIGFCKKEGGVHQEAAWFLRGLPSLKTVFSHIYNTEELIVSMDTLIVWRPWEKDSLDKPYPLSYHIDQNPAYKPGFQCVQGKNNLNRTRTPRTTGSLLQLHTMCREL